MAKRNIVRTDGLDYILDEEILLEENEVEQLGFDFDQDEVDIKNEDVGLVDNKEVRRLCYDYMEKAVQVYLDDHKRGHDFRKIEEVVERPATFANYLNAVVDLCAVSAKIRSLGAFAQRGESANFRADVNEKIERLKELEKTLLDGINRYSEKKWNCPTDKLALRRAARSSSNRKEIRKKLRNDFINKGHVSRL